MSFCANCGAEGSAASQFCGRCGKPLVARAIPTVKKFSVGRKLGVMLIIGIGLSVLMAIIGSNLGPTTQTPTPSISADKWTVKIGRSQMDDSKTVVLSLRADNDVQAWLEDKRPILNIRCKEGKTQVYVWTGTAATVEEMEGHTIRVRLDDGTPSAQTWGESTDHNSLFFDEDAITFVKQIVKAKTLAFQFTPFNASPAVAQFDLRGLENHISDLAAACGWSVD